jgi:hypothetical protein
MTKQSAPGGVACVRCLPSLALGIFDLEVHVCPEVCHGVDDVGISEGAQQTVVVLEIGVYDFGLLC